MKRTRGAITVIGLSLVLACLLAAAGCAQDESPALRLKIIEAQDEIKKAQEEAVALREQLRQRDEQVRTLQALGAGKRLEKVFTVQRIQIGGNSCGLGEANAPWDRGVKAYVEPIDRDGASVKAIGEVTIELYDLALPTGENRIHTGRYPVEDIGKKWIQGFMSQYYIFECEWGRNVPTHKQITVRVVFVDYLTGKTFTDQKVIDVALPPSAPPPSGSAAQPTSATAPASGPSSAPASGPASAPATGPASASQKAGP